MAYLDSHGLQTLWAKIKTIDDLQYYTKTSGLATVALTGKASDLTEGAIYCKTTAEWNAMPTFQGKYGDICIYSDYRTITDNGEDIEVPGIKIADGNAYLKDKLFVTSGVELDLANHIADTISHTTAQEKQFWNNKLNYELDFSNETLVFNRN